MEGPGDFHNPENSRDFPQNHPPHTRAKRAKLLQNQAPGAVPAEFGSTGAATVNSAAHFFRCPRCQPDAPRAAGELPWFPHFAMITGSFAHDTKQVKSIIFL